MTRGWTELRCPPIDTFERAQHLLHALGAKQPSPHAPRGRLPTLPVPPPLARSSPAHPARRRTDTRSFRSTPHLVAVAGPRACAARMRMRCADGDSRDVNLPSTEQGPQTLPPPQHLSPAQLSTPPGRVLLHLLTQLSSLVHVPKTSLRRIRRPHRGRQIRPAPESRATADGVPVSDEHAHARKALTSSKVKISGIDELGGELGPGEDASELGRRSGEEVGVDELGREDFGYEELGCELKIGGGVAWDEDPCSGRRAWSWRRGRHRRARGCRARACGARTCDAASIS
ncbi:hypothetical protein C8R45DRAFT_185379 [Mycena sanguinolenta]|nr:hypothetical protein C8R45DRAFT_185379 [Mycena sanguinolenta]